MSGRRELKELRREVMDATGGIIRMIAYRNSLATRIARIKDAESLPMVDEQVEEDLKKYVFQTCRKEGVSESAGVEVLRCLLKESKRAQSSSLAPLDGRLAEAQPAFRRVAVIGCSGGMGSFLARYFVSKGSSVRGADPRPPAFPYADFSYCKSNAEAVAGAELVVVASPLESTAQVIDGVLADLPDGCVLVELSSVKGHLGASLSKIHEGGRIRVLSLHPLFGPSLQLLKDARMVLVPVGDADEELGLAKRVFPEAEFVVFDRKSHDMAMALSLSLTHVTNLAFCKTLSRYTTPEEFRRVAVPFATLQLSLAEGVLLQDPQLYSQIQMSNEFSGAVMESFAKDVDGLCQIVKDGDLRRFKRVFSELGESYRADAEGHDIMGGIYRAKEQVSEPRRASNP